MRQLWYFLTDCLWLVLFVLGYITGFTKKFEAKQYEKEWNK